MNQSNNQLFGTLYELIEWTFDVGLDAEDRAIFEAELFQGWTNSDESDQELVAYLLRLKDTIWSAPASRRNTVKQQTRALFQKIFSIRENNDRGRIVATLHSIIERRAPGITGLAARPLLVIPQSSAQAPYARPGPMSGAQPGVTTMAPHVASARPPAHSAASPNDVESAMMNRMTEMQRQEQAVAFQTKMLEAQHKNLMTIINMKG